MIRTTKSKTHWNYFIALEQDLENVSRYIEFNEDNFSVYSIELAHLLLATASEVDVIAKLICKRLQPRRRPNDINGYRAILLDKLPDLPKIEVFIPRYGLSLKPWENWDQPNNPNPLWWTSYNKVKHQRDAHFNKATLKNALNALGALLILNFYYHADKPALTGKEKLYPKEITRQLEPRSTLLTLPDDYYYGHLLI